VIRASKIYKEGRYATYGRASGSPANIGRHRVPKGVKLKTAPDGGDAGSGEKNPVVVRLENGGLEGLRQKHRVSLIS